MNEWKYSLIHSFIHSFTLNIYIAPLQENYSEALPTPARSNKAVLKREKNAGEVVLLKMRSSEGRPFQVEGLTTEKARICLVEVRAKGRPCWDERSDRELIALRGGQQSYRNPSLKRVLKHKNEKNRARTGLVLTHRSATCVQVQFRRGCKFNK